MDPDDYYAGLYRSLLARSQPEEKRRLLAAALAKAEKSRVVVWDKTVTLR